MKIEKLIILLRLFSGCGAVGSASGLGPEGRQFESGHPDRTKSLSAKAEGLYCSRALKTCFHKRQEKIKT